MLEDHVMNGVDVGKQQFLEFVGASKHLFIGRRGIVLAHLELDRELAHGVGTVCLASQKWNP